MSRAEPGLGRHGAPGSTLSDETGLGERADRFLEVSELLTGFGRVQLRGTGMTGGYLRALDTVLPGGMLAELLDAFGRLPVGPGRDAALESAILGDPKLGPVARNIIVLWYRGTWTALPEEWRAAYGTSPLDTDHVISSEAYQAGLQWSAAGAHPAGARPQGFGAWALPPEALRPGDGRP